MHDPTRHVYTHPSGVEHWRHLIEIVALLVAALWAFYVFVYQERIKPASESPNVDFTLVVDHAMLRNGLELVTLHPIWRNRASIPIQLDGYQLFVDGVAYRHVQLEPWHSALDVLNAAKMNSKAPVQVYSRGATATTIPIDMVTQPYRPLGGVFPMYIAPGDSWDGDSSTVAVPKASFQSIRAVVAWCVRRADDQHVFNFYPKRRADGTFDVTELWRVEQAKYPDFKNRWCSITGDIEAAL